MDSIEVELQGGGSAALELRVGSEFSILARLPDGANAQGAGEDLFEALCELRTILESSGQRLLCAGARRDVHPSSMQRQAAQGRRAYALGGVPKGEKPPVVDIFDPAEATDVVSVEVQRAWYGQWLEVARGQVVRASSAGEA